MKKILFTFMLTALLFILGIFSYQYVSDTLIRGNQIVSGVVKYHKPDYTVSLDAPEGYYIEASAIGRVYLKHESISEYLDKNIKVSGVLREICGNDQGSCFPLIDARWIADLQFDGKESPQDMVFRMGTGWTGSMGGYPVFENDTNKIRKFIGISMFVNDADAKEILKQGGLTDCFVGRPNIEVSANVTISLLKGENTSTEEPTMERYYEVKINKLYSVNIDAKECKD